MNDKKVNLESGVVSIRGHNLVHLFPDRIKTREELTELLIQGGYVKSTKDPFVDFMLSLPDLAENPETRFLIVANEPDYLCKSCHFWRQNTNACIGDYQYEADKFCAQRFGLELDKVYTAKELKEHIVQ